jgi:hypothetical protein
MLQGCGERLKAALAQAQVSMIPDTCATVVNSVFDAFAKTADLKIDEICKEKPKGEQLECETRGAGNVTAQITAEKKEKVTECITTLNGIINATTGFNLGAVGAQVQAFADKLDGPETTNINSWLTSFAEGEGSKVDPKISRLYLEERMQSKNDNNSGFPWVSLGASMMGVAFAAFGLKRFWKGRAETPSIDEEDVEGLE